MTAMRGSVPSVRAGAGMRLLRAAVFTAVCVALAAVGHGMASGRPVPVWALVVGWLSVFAVVAPLAGRERSLPGIAAALAVGQLALHSVFNVGQVCASMTPAAGAGTASASGSGAGDAGLLAVAARLVCGHTAAAPLTPVRARWIVTQAGLDPSAMGAPVHMPGMDMSASGTGGTGGTGGAAHAMMALPFCSLPMFLGHLLAAVVAGWLLRRGEAALWRLIRLSVRGAAELAALSPAVLRRARTLLSALAAQAAGIAAVRPRRRRTTSAAPARHRTVWLLRHALARRGPPVFLAATTA
ncbi:hypothetical protein SAMN05216251_102348 [Actinacidiphila alni]|uniref:Integral membrane protein n=1 Tax=Actinacidiphila alni TaxID=380248 RepID=A0A1I1Z798_9ACTN|nr:hypothetical protein [Actinacidiphila alni]SFE27656.1 hypothetical protein SAMN05216251_102348 [Actinacidiphila alni]